MTEQETGRFLDLLHDATRIHLRSDVAVGTCLSGGIDSSTLAVLINNLIRDEAPASVSDRQKTFSVVFTDKRFDESRYIDEIVNATGVDSHRTEPAPDQLWDDIDRLVWVQDEPFGSLSIYAQYCVMRLAKEKRQSRAGRAGSRRTPCRIPRVPGRLYPGACALVPCR